MINVAEQFENTEHILWDHTLRSHFEDFRVGDHLRLRLARQPLSVSFFGLTPEVGPAVHAGNV